MIVYVRYGGRRSCPEGEEGLWKVSKAIMDGWMDVDGSLGLVVVGGWAGGRCA